MPGAYKCAVFNCDNTRENTKDKGIKFHAFPKDPNLRSLWCKSLGRSDDWIPHARLAVCSNHFKDDCYNYDYAGVKQHLKPGTVPSVFGNTDDNIQPKKMRLSVESGERGESSSSVVSVPSPSEVPESFSIEDIPSLPLATDESRTEIFHKTKSSAQALELHSYASRETTKAKGVQTEKEPVPKMKSVATLVRPTGQN